MTRVFENHEFEAVAAKATKAAKEDVMKRFYIPICGNLRCKYMGTQKSDEKDLIIFTTKVVFKWELSSPRVKGSVDLAFRFCFVLFVVVSWELQTAFVWRSAVALWTTERHQASTDNMSM